MKSAYVTAIGIAVIAIIGVAAIGGYMAMQTRGQTSSNLSPTTTSQSQTSSPTTTSQSQTGSPTTTTSISQSSSGQGKLAMQMTDPPIVAAGVSSAVVTYDGVEVHSAASSQTDGWVQMNARGTINLTSSANVGQTIASANIQSGVYDQVRVNITSGTVTYHNQQYKATIASGSLTVQMQQSAHVNTSVTTQAIIDLRTFVINSGNTSSPQFIFSASAKATAEPASAVTSSSTQVGSETSLQGQEWYVAFTDQTSTNATITSATLTADSLNLAVKNTGNATADIQTVIITPVSSSARASSTLPASLDGSAVFALTSSGSLQASNTLQGVALLASSGTQINAASSTTLSYTGLLSLGFGSTGGLQISGIVSGQSYLVTCMGANTFASTIVVAP